jgi:hypothetical protein
LLKCLLNEQGCIAACRRTGGAAFFQQHNNDVLDFNSVDALGGYQDV